jgi:NAD(P)H-quinone oxidoreductase subunit 5
MISGDATLTLITIMLFIGAAGKSAQLPLFTWLPDAMAGPTPVSALLHAGLLNAGPFLITRMAFVMDGTTYAPIVLIIIGGFTALFASLVFMTQSSIKTSLGYSSVAHMGFSLMMCGLGVYSAAMLHLVAHSFYKAHSFLSSGSVIDVVRSSKVELPKRLGSPFRIIGSILIAMFIYLCFALLWGIDPSEEFGILAAGSIIVMGLSIIIAPALDSSSPLIGTLRACLLAVTVTLSFFSLESGAHYLLSTQIPELTQPGILTMLLMGFILLVYSAVVVIQIVAPTVSSNSFWWKMEVHFRNGLYVNSIFDRMVKSLYHSPEKQKLTANK